MIVHLDYPTLMRALDVAKLRADESRKRGIKSEKYKPKPLPQIVYDCMGAYGEYAVAQAYGFTEPNHVNRFVGHDTGTRTYVRAIGHWEPREGKPPVPPSEKNLIVRPKESTANLYVLALVRVPFVELRGWIEARDARSDEWWRGDMWLVRKLRPMSELARGSM